LHHLSAVLLNRLRSYLPDDHPDKAKEIGQEPTLRGYLLRLVEVFREVRRVLKEDGTCWVNCGDSFAGYGGGGQGKNGEMRKRAVVQARSRMADKLGGGFKPKDLMMVPARLAIALCEDGWWLRSEVVWWKRNSLPESVKDRPSKAHEMIYLLAKSERYLYDAAAVREPDSGSEHARNRKARAYPGQKTLPGTLVNGIRPHQKKEPLIGAHSTMGHDGNGMRMPEKWNNPAGRNKRTVWDVPEPMFRLRKDLTPQQRLYVLQRIAALGCESPADTRQNST
jgi:hypothetical protein